MQSPQNVRQGEILGYRTIPFHNTQGSVRKLGQEVHENRF